MPRGLPLLVTAGWLVLTPITLVTSLYLYANLSHRSVGHILGASDGPYTLFSAPPPLLGGVGQSVVPGDARAILLDNFFHKYHSPLQGQGALTVSLADKYHLDWRITAAIAYQESNLGRVIPRGSYNAWGWGVFTGKNSGALFESWPKAIETVSQGLAKDYYARGLKTPKQIMTRYTPSSNGSWAESVQAAMDEIEAN